MIAINVRCGKHPVHLTEVAEAFDFYINLIFDPKNGTLEPFAYTWRSLYDRGEKCTENNFGLHKIIQYIMVRYALANDFQLFLATKKMQQILCVKFSAHCTLYLS